MWMLYETFRMNEHDCIINTVAIKVGDSYSEEGTVGFRKYKIKFFTH